MTYFSRIAKDRSDIFPICPPGFSNFWILNRTGFVGDQLSCDEKRIASQGNIEQNEIYMIFIMLSKSNEFGKKVRAGMAFVKSGNNCNEKLCYCALYSSRLMQNLEIQGVWRGKNTDMVLDALSYVSSFELEAMYDYKINPLGQVD